MKHAYWTTGEVRRLRKMCAISCSPSSEALLAALPRHPIDSIRTTAYQLGCSSRRENSVPFRRTLYWLRVAHEYFARRESGLLA